MLLTETIRGAVIAQREDLARLKEGILREVLPQIDPDMHLAIVLCGIRRCGKSTLMRQLMKKVKGFYYFNFEDPRIAGFEIADFQKLDEVFSEEYGALQHYFFDEVQNVPGWEIFVRSRLDAGKKFVITGSNASLLSRELGTKLTGRHLPYELFPFSFREMLKFTGKKGELKSFEQYFLNGGFPEYLREGKEEILHTLMDDIISRDIVVRHRLKSASQIRGLATYLISNSSKEFSYNGLRKTFGLGSTNSIINFVAYLEDSYLFFTVPKFDYSLKKQAISPKKIYCIDNGLANSSSASFSQDRGKMLENCVFLKLRKDNGEIFYFKGHKECDFVVKEKNKIVKAIQVCYQLTEENKERELEGMAEALEKFNLKEGLILTYNQHDDFTFKGRKIKVLPVWKWMLD
ncbi:MAG TPA: ATP-binding protein [archaeon]|nr:ATP-binding protein [archaeon]